MDKEELDKFVEAEYMKAKAEADKKQDEQETKENVPAPVTESQNNLPQKFEMPNFIPKIDTNKDLEEQASDVVKLLGAQQASENANFMNEVSANFQKGVLTDQEVKNMRKEMLLEKEYFLKWQDVLSFVFIKSPHGLLFMQIMTWIAMFIYVPTRIVGMVVKSIGMIGDFLNEIFNSIFGGKGKYLRNANGDVILDPVTKKPYIEKQGYNLFAKVLFGIIIGGIALALLFLFVQLFTGFSIFEWFRGLL